MINQHKPPIDVIKLLCLYCAMNNGIYRYISDEIQSLLIHHYGREYAFIIDHLYQVGLLYYDKVTTLNKNQNFNYYNGYIPISYHIIESILTNNLKT